MPANFLYAISVLIAAGIACLVWGLVLLAIESTYFGWPLTAVGLIVLVGTYVLYLRNGRKPSSPRLNPDRRL